MARTMCTQCQQTSVGLMCLSCPEHVVHCVLHAWFLQVLIVGYGHDQNSGLDYWKIKNSWGLDWGEAGYCRLIRNADNRCGVASDASHAVAAI